MRRFNPLRSLRLVRQPGRTGGARSLASAVIAREAILVFDVDRVYRFRVVDQEAVAVL